MSPQSNPVQPSAGAASSPGGAPGRVLSSASAARSDAVRASLKDKNLGLLCDDPSLEDALLAYRAAVELGARVALVRPRFTGEQQLRAVPETAHMLGRLYDIIVCVALPADLVAALRRDSGLPVVADIDVEPRAGSLDAPCVSIDDFGALVAEQRLHQWQETLAASLT